jgi:pyruvate-formate lyase-activating enzyme
MLFAHLKRILRLGRLRLRGPCGAQFEFTLAAIAQNLRRLAKFIARSPPEVDACPPQFHGASKYDWRIRQKVPTAEKINP